MRTLTEILKEADKATSVIQLRSLFNEIANNKFEYTAAELEFAKEHFETLGIGLWFPLPERAIHFNNPAMVDNTEKVISPGTLRKSPLESSLKELTEKLMDSGIEGAYAGKSLRDLLLKFPKKPSFWQRLKQAWKILIGK